METSTRVSPPRKKSKKMMLGIGAAVVIVLAGLGTAYAKFDLFKSAKTIYLQAEAASMLHVSTEVSNAYAEYEAYMKPYLEQPVHSTTEISDIALDAEIPDPAAQAVLDLLNSAKIIVNSHVDEQKGQQSGNVELHLKGKPLTSLSYFRNDTLFGFQLPDFYSKYAYLDLKDRDALRETWGEEFPKRFVTIGDLFQAVKFEQDEVKNALAPYALLYADSLKDSQVSINKNAIFHEEGYETSVKEITVSFTQEEASALLKQIAEKAQADETLFTLLYTRYSNLATLMDDSGYDVEVISKEDFKQEYDRFFADMIEEVQAGTKTEEQLKMVVLVDSNNRIVSRKLYFTGEQGNQEQVLWNSVAFQNGADTYHRYSLHDPSNHTDNVITVTYKETEQSGKTNGTLSLLFLEETVPQLDFNTTFETTQKEQTEDGTYSFTLSVQDESTGKPISLSGTITSSVTKTNSGRQSAADVTLNFDQATPDMPKGVSVTVNVTEEFGKPLEIPAMSAENSVNLATLTEEQMMEMQEELGISMQQFMDNNAVLFEDFMMMP